MVMDAKAGTRQLIGIFLSIVPAWVLTLISTLSRGFARVLLHEYDR